MKNLDIREKAAQANVKLWQIAEELGICDTNFSKKLRHELPTEEKEKIFAIIDELAKEAETFSASTKPLNAAKRKKYRFQKKYCAALSGTVPCHP